jgi:hypothetical protein
VKIYFVVTLFYKKIANEGCKTSIHKIIIQFPLFIRTYTATQTVHVKLQLHEDICYGQTYTIKLSVHLYLLRNAKSNYVLIGTQTELRATRNVCFNVNRSTLFCPITCFVSHKQKYNMKLITLNNVGLVLTAVSLKMAVLWFVATCRLEWVYRRFRGLYCLRWLANSYQWRRRYNPEDSHFLIK